jgi:hypothetical protein
MDPDHVPLLSLTPLCRPPPTRSLPVDPEHVPDYYDVVTCPMDMETMRMKVLIRPYLSPYLGPYVSPYLMETMRMKVLTRPYLKAPI